MTIHPVLFILSFLAAMLAAEGLYLALRSRSQVRHSRTRRRLREIGAPRGRDEETTLLRVVDSGRLYGFLRRLPGFEALELKLCRAGKGSTPARFVGTSLGFGALGAFAGTVFLGATPGMLIGAACAAAPSALTARAIGRRKTEFENQFPDALDLLIRALRAGHSLSVGMQMVAEELPDPVGTEFALVADEIQLGQDVSVALANLATRMPTEDVPFFVVAITIQQETGSNLAEVLENLSTVIRERFKLYGKVRALTAMGRASANLLAVWPVIMVGALMAVNADYIAPLWETPEGHSMLYVAIGMIAVGYVGCRRMATIQV